MKYALLGFIAIIGFVIIAVAISTSKPKVSNTVDNAEMVVQNTQLASPTPEVKLGDDATQSGAAAVGTATPKTTMKAQTKSYTEMPKMTIDVEKTYIATMNTTKGVMKIALYPQDAPNTVNNFVFLAKEGFYNNTPFHRIIKGFMIQGGDPTGTGMGGPGYKFADEKVTKDYTKGTIAMANSGANTNGSQFFIMHADYPLPKNYVIFGKIIDGDEASIKTLDAIANTAVSESSSGEQSKPVEQILIANISIEQK